MRQVIVASAFQYADDPVGATGLMVKDYRGKNSERPIWKLMRPWCRRSTTHDFKPRSSRAKAD